MPKKKKSTKKAKGKKGSKKTKGKKSKTKAKVIEAPAIPIFPWEVDLNMWMGSVEFHRKKLRPGFRETYTAIDNPPLYDESEWGQRLFDNMEPSSDHEVEEMVMLLVVLIRFEGSRKNPPDNLARIAAAIRALNDNTNLLRMREVLFSFFAMLDTEPSPQNILDIVKTSDGQATQHDNVATFERLTKFVDSHQHTFGDTERAAREEMQRELAASSSNESQTKQIDKLASDGVDATKLLLLEKKILQTVADDKEMTKLWQVLDINHDGAVSYHEVLVFISIHYPAMAVKTPARCAFEETTGSATADLMRPKFKGFLLKLFYFCRFWAAFVRIDDNNDKKISLDEWKEGSSKLSAKLDFEFKGNNEEFKEIAGKDDIITFQELAQYYTKVCAAGHVLDEDWNPDVVPPAIILKFKGTDFVDLVLHCHYATRE